MPFLSLRREEAGAQGEWLPRQCHTQAVPPAAAGHVQAWSGPGARRSTQSGGWWEEGRTAGVHCPRAGAEDWEATWVGPWVPSQSKGSPKPATFRASV